MREPGLAGLRIARGGEAVGEADLRRPAVLVGQCVERDAVGLAVEFRRQVFLRGAERLARLAFLGRVAPLHDEVVLRAVDAHAVPVALVREGADVAGMLGREPWREFDDDTAARQFQVDRVGGIQAAPVGGLRGVEHFLRGLGFWCVVGGGERRNGGGNQEGKQDRAHSWTSCGIGSPSVVAVRIPSGLSAAPGGDRWLLQERRKPRCLYGESIVASAAPAGQARLARLEPLLQAAA